MKTRTLLQTALAASVLTICSTGCLHTRPPRVLDPFMDPVRMEKLKPYAPPCDGYFIPDAKMKQILDRLSEIDVFGEGRRTVTPTP